MMPKTEKSRNRSISSVLRLCVAWGGQGIKTTDYEFKVIPQSRTKTKARQAAGGRWQLLCTRNLVEF